jgi:lipopolysaccharide biosynthesis glycosyltransferase
MFYSWKQIPIKWNVLPYYFNYRKIKKLVSKEDIEEYYSSTKKPMIIHYTDHPKPWEYMSSHPLKKEYYFYLQKTPYHGFIPHDKTFINFFKKKTLPLLTFTLNRSFGVIKVFLSYTMFKL